MPNNIIKGKKIWLIGAGIISAEYVKVLLELDCDITVISRGKRKLKNLKKFKKKIRIFYGGISNYLKNSPEKPHKVIIASNARYLYEISILMIKYGVKSILVEKPGALKLEEFKKLKKIIKKNNFIFKIAYNRRFYGSIKYLNKILKKNKIRSIYFDLTEWLQKIKTSNYSKQELNKWFLCNSSHITDLVFYLIGYPKKINFMYKDSIKWHKPVLFNGYGISKRNIPFSYRGDWLSYGRWEIKVFFKDFLVNLKPIETIEIKYIANKDTKKIKNFDYEKLYKPGLFFMCKDFLNNNYKNFCTIDQQILNIKFINNILGWKK